MFQCPAGSTAVSGGGGIMCRCADGTYANISGCRSASRPQYNAPTQRQQPSVRMLQRQINVVRQRNNQRANAPAFNKTTQKWERRQGGNVVTHLGGKIWYQTTDYSGPAYVFADFIDAFIELTNNYEELYEELSSNDPDRIFAAANQIEEIARNQGLLLPQGIGME